jgi:hypothetical protein
MLCRGSGRWPVAPLRVSWSAVTFTERFCRTVRSMKYALMTGLLTVAYAGLVLLAIQVLSLHTPVAVAACTLTAAVLFNLPRRHLQRAVNRRFRRLA